MSDGGSHDFAINPRRGTEFDSNYEAEEEASITSMRNSGRGRQKWLATHYQEEEDA